MKPELLAPAGDLDKLKYAIEFGADAIYCGLPDFSLRYRINKFGYKELGRGIELAHAAGKKVYVTINIFPHQKHLQKLPNHIAKLKKIKPDALIISDPGIISYVRQVWPKIDIHLSTQANCTNWRAAKFWFDQGITRVILARETTLKDIKEIHQKVPKLELECFVHGAMCMAYSGRCILSKWFTDRSANLGDCTQPCRWHYKVKKTNHVACNTQHAALALEESSRPENYFPIEEDENGTYILNSKDLCLIDHLDKLKEAGITSFKIEGRAKSIYYVANTVKVYRQAIDKIGNKKQFLNELQKSPNRGFTTGFILGEKEVSHRFNSAHEKCDWEFCGEVIGQRVKNKSLFAKIKVHNALKLKDKIEIITPAGNNSSITVKKIFNKNFQELLEAHGGQEMIIYVPMENIIPVMSLLRRKL